VPTDPAWDAKSAGPPALSGDVPLARDAQRWMLDYAIGQTGKTFHFQGGARGSLPPAVRMHDMISKHLGLAARRQERLAEEEAAAGHDTTASEYYFLAAGAYAGAQHVILHTDEEKRQLYDSSVRCFDRVRELAPYEISRIEIPFQGEVLGGYLHRHPDGGSRPLVLFVPGCDMTKEMYPNPRLNHAHARGLDLFVIDGPGQGESNLRGISLGSDNYGRSLSAALDVLANGEHVSPSAFGVYGFSFGSRWAMQFGALDERLSAIVCLGLSVCEMRYLMDVESPRWKMLFAYITGARSEAELDALTDAMSLEPLLARVRAPTLWGVGEYDPRSPLGEVYRLFDLLTCERELWVFADQHHMPSLGDPREAPLWDQHAHMYAFDWLRDRFEGNPVAHSGDVCYLDRGVSPRGPRATLKRRWYEEA
jgi:naringenin degradation protein FdeB